ncbi:hypothetical protein EUX98_g4230 [Antrodiella citrinella]|uniref:HAT C-terminal dimerisation domain-containing protein n=1 Tax=Antrodiella citrinella TaxID=2447956 RepID=A0A4S4MUF9_9APHY|nr:hypothetical protein EUX98_g4230 [Antrodiella citrinella]
MNSDEGPRGPSKRKANRDRYHDSMKALKTTAQSTASAAAAAGRKVLATAKKSTKTKGKKPASAVPTSTRSATSPIRSSPNLDEGDGVRPRPSIRRESRVLTEEEEDAALDKMMEDVPDVTEILSDEEEKGDEDEESGGEEPEDAESQLKRLQADWKAPVYAFYGRDIEIVERDGRRIHKFHCIKPGCKVAISRYLDTTDSKSTGNLTKHIQKCWGQDALESARNMKTADGAQKSVDRLARTGSITVSFKRVGKGKVTYSIRQLNSTETRATVVDWVAGSLRPFKIVQDPAFLKLMKSGQPEYWVPSPTTVARDVHQVFASVRQRVAEMLNEHEGDLSFAADCWTSPNHRAYMAITVHYEKEGEAKCLPLDVVEVPFSHTGVALAEEFERVLREFGIQDKFLAFTSDNATNNDSMVAHLEKINDVFGAKKILSPFDTSKTKVGGPADLANRIMGDLDNLADDLELAEEDLASLGDIMDGGEAGASDDNMEGWEDEDISHLTEEERREYNVSALPVKQVLVKLRKIAYAIINSTTKLLPAWKKILADLGLKDRKMPRDVATRWNSTYTMLAFAIEYRRALDRLTQDREMLLREFELTEEEWEFVRQLRDVLKIFYDSTTYFSSSTPNIAQIIPSMDMIDRHLATAMVNSQYCDAIRSAAKLAKVTLNRYYSKTDMTDIYRIAMVLHPRHKLEYFITANWDAEWIATAKRITYDKFLNSYVGRAIAEEDNEDDSGDDSDKPGESQRSTSKNTFSAAEMFAPLQTLAQGNELDRYLREDLVDLPPGDSALKWWYDRRKVYPCLSRMARDFLSIPATSVDVERIFSKDEDVLKAVKQPAAENVKDLAKLAPGWDRIDKTDFK